MTKNWGSKQTKPKQVPVAANGALYRVGGEVIEDDWITSVPASVSSDVVLPTSKKQARWRVHLKHLPGKHDQSTHGRRGPGSAAPALERTSAYQPARYRDEAGLEQLPCVQQPKTRNEYKELYPNHDDPQLYAIARDQGFDGQGQHVSADELKRMVDAGEVTEIWRGVNGWEESDTLNYKKQLQTGDEPFYGSGVSGNGMYFAKDHNEAASYDGRNEIGVVHAGLRKDARTINLEDLQRMVNEKYNPMAQKAEDDMWAAYETYKKNGATPEARAQFKAIEARKNALIGGYGLLGEDGRFAAAMGYDAIIVPARGHIVILNRTALVIEVE